jgi:hypothetical protein
MKTGGGNWRIRRKPNASAILTAINPTWPDLGSNLNHYGTKPENQLPGMWYDQYVILTGLYICRTFHNSAKTEAELSLLIWNCIQIEVQHKFLILTFSSSKYKKNWN